MSRWAVRPGDGCRLMVEAFTESRSLGRIVTARVDVRRAPGDESADAWRVVSLQPLTVVEGLNRLEVDETRQFAARGLVLTSEDLKITLADGSVFVVNSAAGVTGLVLLGRGQLEFSPAPQMEREQLRLFADTETLVAPFETAFVRINPGDFVARKVDAALVPATVDPRLLRRARDVFTQEAPKSFSVDLGDLSRETWSLLPQAGDFLAEVRTRVGHGVTYARSNADAEDVSFFERAKGRDIALRVDREAAGARASLQRGRLRGLRRRRLRHRGEPQPAARVRGRARPHADRDPRADPGGAERPPGGAAVVHIGDEPEPRAPAAPASARATIVVNLPVALRRGDGDHCRHQLRWPAAVADARPGIAGIAPVPGDFQQVSVERGTC